MLAVSREMLPTASPALVGRLARRVLFLSETPQCFPIDFGLGQNSGAVIHLRDSTRKLDLPREQYVS